MKNIITLFVMLLLFISPSMLAQLTVKDQEPSPNTLFQVIDDGSSGLLLIPPLVTLSGDSDQKLYNISGTLYWNGNQVGTSFTAAGWEDIGDIVRLSTASDKVGIGSPNPVANLHIFGPEGLLVQSEHGIGTPQSHGDGTRMHYYPYKSAFRAGYSVGDNWDDAKIGEYSVAMCLGTKASGFASVAFGEDCFATGWASTAFGMNTYAAAYGSTTLGIQSHATGYGSTSIGNITKAESHLSIALGVNNIGGGTPDSWIPEDPLFEIGNGFGGPSSNALTILKNGKVAIGKERPNANLDVYGVDGVVFEGDRWGIGNIPASGAGARMMWYPKKFAFRAGLVDGTQWDDSNIGEYSIALGLNNIASQEFSVALGGNSSATGYASFAMGYLAKASSYFTTAIGCDTEATDYSAIAMGYNAKAGGAYSVAIGKNVTTNGSGSFVFGDDSPDILSKGVNNRFYGRFSAGYVLYTNPEATISASLWGGANSWTTTSDSTKKENFRPIDGYEILDKISKFKLGTWNYIGQDPNTFRHYGPMAQDFFNAFGKDDLGTIGCDTLLSSADFDGVNFIAIQALEKRTRKQQAKIDLLETKIDQLERLIAFLTFKDEDKSFLHDDHIGK